MINVEERSAYAAAPTNKMVTTTGSKASHSGPTAAPHGGAGNNNSTPPQPVLKCVCGWKNCRAYHKAFRDAQHPILDGAIKLKICQNDPDAVALKKVIDRVLKVPEEKRADWKPGKRQGEEFVRYVIAHHHFTEKHLKKYLDDPHNFSFIKPMSIHGAKKYLYAVDPKDTVMHEGEADEPLYLQVPNVTREHVKQVFTNLKQELSGPSSTLAKKAPPAEKPSHITKQDEAKLKAKEEENQRLKEQLESMQGQLSFLHDMVKKLQEEHFATATTASSTRSGSEHQRAATAAGKGTTTITKTNKPRPTQKRTMSANSRRSGTGVPHEIELGSEDKDEDNASNWNENTEEDWSEAVDETGDETIDDETTVATFKVRRHVDRRGSMGSHTTRASFASRGSYISRTSRATSIVSASKSVKSLPREVGGFVDDDDDESSEETSGAASGITGRSSGVSGEHSRGNNGAGGGAGVTSPRKQGGGHDNRHHRRGHSASSSVHSGRNRNSRQAARRQSVGGSSASVGGASSSSNKSVTWDKHGSSTVSTDQGSTASAGTYQVTALVVTDPYGEQGTYTGSISTSTGMPHGYGRLEYDRAGRWYEGDWKHGRWTGQGRLSNGDGDFYEGGLKNDHKHGLGVMKFADGRVFEGEYINGQMIEGKMTYQDGSTYGGSWVDGMRHGRGRCVFTDESVYEGEFREGEFFGYGKMSWSDGGWYEGEWWNGEMHGRGREIRPDGSLRHDGEWSKGQPIRR